MLAPALLTSVFHAIANVLTNLAHVIVVGLQTWANGMIAIVGAAVSLFVNLLPTMPSAPSSPVGGWVSSLNWLVPVAPLVAGLVTFVGLWAIYLVVRIPLRWLKVL